MEHKAMEIDEAFEIPELLSIEPRCMRSKRRECAGAPAADRFTIAGAGDSGAKKRARPLGFPSPVFYSGMIATESRAERISKRPIPKMPFRVLDAPSIMNDYYLNLLDWSSTNVIALGLGDHLYLWNAATRKTSLLVCSDPGQYVSSVSYSGDGVLAAGFSNGVVEVYDVAREVPLRRLKTRNSRVPSLSWGAGVLSAGGRDGTIFNHDVRAEDDHVSSFLMHSQEVCGLKWDANGVYLASGSNDNSVGVWKMGSVRPKERLDLHVAAVRALAWCPWKRGVLCTGGGSKDKTIKSWDVERGKLLESVDAGSQVCGLLFSEKYKEILSTHGYLDNDIRVWKFCNMRQVGAMNGHEDRVLYSALSPEGDMLATCAADENLNFWMLFDQKRREEYDEGAGHALR